MSIRFKSVTLIFGKASQFHSEEKIFLFCDQAGNGTPQEGCRLALVSLFYSNGLKFLPYGAGQSPTSREFNSRVKELVNHRHFYLKGSEKD